MTYGSLVARAGAGRRLGLALDLWREMKRRGVRADVPATNALLNAYAKVQRCKKGHGVPFF